MSDHKLTGHGYDLQGAVGVRPAEEAEEVRPLLHVLQAAPPLEGRGRRARGDRQEGQALLPVLCHQQT